VLGDGKRSIYEIYEYARPRGIALCAAVIVPNEAVTCADGGDETRQPYIEKRCESYEPIDLDNIFDIGDGSSRMTTLT
jgi:hypothetical protein